MGMQDINRLAENILIPLFSEVFNYSNLKNLNKTEKPNFPGIDLGDKVARVAFQITASSDNDKVKDTLQKFVSYGLYNQYDRLIIYILTEKQKTYSGSGFEEIIQGKFIFNKDKDILDYRDVLAEVKELSIEKADRVKKILEKNFGKSNIDLFSTDRSAILISHSKPDGNNFSQWLALKLLGQGYSVWCDMLNLTGGEDSWLETKTLISDKASLFLYVVTAKSNLDQGSFNELQYAYDFMRKQQKEGFIIPLVIENIEQNNLNIFIRNIHPISFVEGWAVGLNSLIAKLEELGIRKYESLNQNTVNLVWRNKLDPSTGIIEQTEEYLSNWFPVQNLPRHLYFHELQRTGGIGAIAVNNKNLPFPGLQHNIYLVSFAEAVDFSGYLDSSLAIKQTTELRTIDFLDGNYDQKLARKELAWNYIVQLLQQAWEKYLDQKYLGVYQMANKKNCHYFHKGFADTKFSFKGVKERVSRRNLVGYKTMWKENGDKEKRYWLFGIEGKVMLSPLLAYIVKPHVLFSNDGYQIWKSAARLHTARRSWCKNWWNDDWRDRILASMAWLGNNNDVIDILISRDISLHVDVLPISFISPISYIEPQQKSINIEQVIEEDMIEYEYDEVVSNYDEYDDQSGDDD